MTAARFTVLASGSTGNACLLQADGFGLLIDCGIGPRTLARRMARCGVSWRDVHAVILTHVHGDHWNEAAFRHMRRLCLPLYCHAGHGEYLADASTVFADLHAGDSVRSYESGVLFSPTPSLTCRPLPVSHDCGATFGFRFDGAHGLYGPNWAIAYVADLGCWDDELALALADVDLLAIEFNHDVQMQMRSGRPFHLIQRILGDFGHLSNEQAAGLLRSAISASTHGCLRHVVPLHLSRDCNRASLARNAARAALETAGSAATVHIHEPDRGGPSLTIGQFKNRGRKSLGGATRGLTSTIFNGQPRLADAG
jgi:phosphoribosyl 1,2-cyclic phosphodiesterase